MSHNSCKTTQLMIQHTHNVYHLPSDRNNHCNILQGSMLSNNHVSAPQRARRQDGMVGDWGAAADGRPSCQVLISNDNKEQF